MLHTFLLSDGFYAALMDWMNNRFHMPFQEHKALWKAIGLTGMIIFGSRTFVQWIYSERHKEMKVPVIFWWLSVVGTLVCLSYALRQKDSIFILMYLFNMIPYVRNLMLINRKNKEERLTGGLSARPNEPVPAVAAH